MPTNCLQLCIQPFIISDGPASSFRPNAPRSSRIFSSSGSSSEEGGRWPRREVAPSDSAEEGGGRGCPGSGVLRCCGGSFGSREELPAKPVDSSKLDYRVTAATLVQSGQLCKRASSCCDVSDDYPTVTYFFTHKPSQHTIRDAKQKYENPLGKINPNRNRCGVHSFDRRRPASIRALPQLAGTRPPACLHPSAAAARQNSAAAHHFPPRCSTRLQAAVPAIRPWSTADAAPRMEDAARHQASERRRRGP